MDEKSKKINGATVSISKRDLSVISNTLNNGTYRGISFEGQLNLAKTGLSCGKASQDYTKVRDSILNNNKVEGHDELLAELQVIESKPKELWTPEEIEEHKALMLKWKPLWAQLDAAVRPSLTALDSEKESVNIYKISKADFKIFVETNGVSDNGKLMQSLLYIAEV